MSNGVGLKNNTIYSNVVMMTIPVLVVRYPILPRNLEGLGVLRKGCVFDCFLQLWPLITVVIGCKWDYTLCKWDFVSTCKLVKGHNCIPYILINDHSCMFLDRSSLFFVL